MQSNYACDYSKIFPNNQTTHIKNEMLNKLFIQTTPFALTTPPNPQTKSWSFQPRSKTHKSYLSPNAYDDSDSKIASKKTIILPPNVRAITSTSNPFVKHCVKLRQSSTYRHFHAHVLVVGSTPIR